LDRRECLHILASTASTTPLAIIALLRPFTRQQGAALLWIVDQFLGDNSPRVMVCGQHVSQFTFSPTVVFGTADEIAFLAKLFQNSLRLPPQGQGIVATHAPHTHPVKK